MPPPEIGPVFGAMRRIDTTSLEIPAGRLEVLAENYRWEADLCVEMARRTDGAVRKDWFLAAAKWIEMAEQVGASGRPPNCSPRAYGSNSPSRGGPLPGTLLPP